MNSKYRVLSLDGGGSRGIYTAGLLTELENANDGYLLDNFDLVIGTSTGGIIASGLASGLVCGDLLKLYRSEIPKIFNRSLAYKLKSVFGILSPKYSNKNLIECVTKYIGNEFITTSKTRMIVTAYATDTNDVRLIDSKDNKAVIPYTFSQAAIATASAPTYFPSYNGLIDGGIYANNPSMIGLMEGLKLGYNFKDIIIVNVGTGFSFKGHNTTKFGIKKWMSTSKSKPLLDMMFDGMAEKDSYIISKLLADNYLYINPELPKKYPMDVTDLEILNHLEGLGRQHYEYNKDKLRQLIYEDIQVN